MDDQVLAMLCGQLADIISGAIFSFAGLAVCSIAAIRQRSGVRLFAWLAIWSATYGAGLLARSPAVVAALPRPFPEGRYQHVLVVTGQRFHDGSALFLDFFPKGVNPSRCSGLDRRF